MTRPTVLPLVLLFACVGSLHMALSKNLPRRFDIKHLASLAAPRPVTLISACSRARTEPAELADWYRTLGGEFQPLPQSPQSPPRRHQGGSSGGRVYKTSIDPHWFADNTCFWYRNDLREGKREFIVVDAAAGLRRSAFDHQRLADAMGEAGI